MKGLRALALPVLVAVLLAGCRGGSGSGAASNAGARSASTAETEDAGSAGIKPCELLSKAQVATVLPEPDDGFQAHAGGSLIKGVDAYQCSYSNPATNILTVILNVAADDERFEDITPGSLIREGRKVDVGDGGWLRGEDDHIKLTAVKGRTVIDLELMAPKAREKADALVELARAVAAKLS
jgi:hypothetical protein